MSSDPLGLTDEQRRRSDMNEEILRISERNSLLGPLIEAAAMRIMEGHFPDVPPSPRTRINLRQSRREIT